MPEPGITETQNGLRYYPPDYKLTGPELRSEGTDIVVGLESLFKEDPDIQKEVEYAIAGTTIAETHVRFHKGKALYIAPASQFVEGTELTNGEKFNLVRYDEHGNEENLNIDTGTVPTLAHNLVFTAITPINRDYIPDIGLAVSGAREMLGRARRDFAK
jgi:hypothetical protein